MLVYKELSLQAFNPKFSQRLLFYLFIQNVIRYIQCIHYVDKSFFDIYFKTMPDQIEQGFVMSFISFPPNKKTGVFLVQPSDEEIEQKPSVLSLDCTVGFFLLDLSQSNPRFVCSAVWLVVLSWYLIMFLIFAASIGFFFPECMYKVPSHYLRLIGSINSLSRGVHQKK